MMISTCYIPFFLSVITCPCVQMGGVYIVCVDNVTSAGTIKEQESSLLS